MNTRLVHDIAAIVLAVPLLGISGWAAFETPSLLNPWNKNPWFPNLWILVLPTLLCSIGIIINGVLAVGSALKNQVS
jgi:hypothetical protein